VACFLCNRTDIEEHNSFEAYCFLYQCPSCGIYGIERNISQDSLLSNDMLCKAACIAAERNTKGMDNFMLLTDSNEKLWESDSCKEYSPIGITNFLKEYPQDAGNV